MKSFSEFLKELQDSHSARQTRWVWGASLVSFVFIFSLWGIYLKYQLSPSFSLSSSLVSVSTPAPDSSAPGLLISLKEGLASVSAYLKQAALSENTFEVVNPDFDYLPSASPLPTPPPLPFPLSRLN